VTPVLRKFLKACYHQIEEAADLRWYEQKPYLIGQDMQIAVWLDNTGAKTLKRCVGVICPWYDNPGSSLEAQLFHQTDYKHYIELEPVGDNYAIAVANLNRAIKSTKQAATLEQFAIERSQQYKPDVAYHRNSQQLIERFIYQGKFDRAREQIDYFRSHECKSLLRHHHDLDDRILCWDFIRAREVDIEEVQRRLIFRAEQNRAYFSLDEHLLSNRLLPRQKQSIPWLEKIQEETATWLASAPDY
jgi:hypothetical protein